MNATLAQLESVHGFDVLDHLDRDAEVPVLGGLQFQGDLAVIPAILVPWKRTSSVVSVPGSGVAVIPATGGGHEHRLLAGTPGTAFWQPETGGQDIGWLQCTEPAFLAHVEHGYLGIAPGTYVLRRQREQADEERLVAD